MSGLKVVILGVDGEEVFVQRLEIGECCRVVPIVDASEHVKHVPEFIIELKNNTPPNSNGMERIDVRMPNESDVHIKDMCRKKIGE